MKEEILKLRSEGKSYKQISRLLNCSKSTVSYHCSPGQKEKTLFRTRKKRKKILQTKLERFRNRRSLKLKSRDFQRRKNGSLLTKADYTFTVKDVLDKFGEETFCYLTGKKINLIKDNNYEMDHIIPASKGGLNTLDNLGILDNEINRMKHNLTVDELINYCILILKYKGYSIRKKKES